jgi:hypothetical protein
MTHFLHTTETQNRGMDLSETRRSIHDTNTRMDREDDAESSRGNEDLIHLTED